MDTASLIRRLRERKLVQWTLAYLAAAAALFGTLATIGEVFAWRAGVLRAVFFLLFAGLLATIVLAWYHGDRGRQRVSPIEVMLLAVAALVGFAGAGASLRSDAGRASAVEAMQPRSPDVRNSVAYEHYERGEHALRQRTPASVIEAISEYREAARLDPTFTAAIAREAYAYALFIDWGWTYPALSHEMLMERGSALAQQALAQDSSSAEAWLAHAYLLQLRDPHRFSGAADAFGQAVTLGPSNAEAQHQYGQTLMALGRYPEAKVAYHAALATEPDRPLTLVALAAIAAREGDPAHARRWSDSSVVLAAEAPYAWASRAMVRLRQGDAAGARSDAEEALRIEPSHELPARSALAAALAALGDTAAAEQALERARRALTRPDRPSATDAIYLASAMLRLGHRDDAIELLESAEPRGAWLWFYLQSSDFSSLHDDPRFSAILQDADPR